MYIVYEYVYTCVWVCRNLHVSMWLYINLHMRESSISICRKLLNIHYTWKVRLYKLKENGLLISFFYHSLNCFKFSFHKHVLLLYTRTGAFILPGKPQFTYKYPSCFIRCFSFPSQRTRKEL